MLRSEEAAMKPIRVLAAFAFICAVEPAFAAGQDEDWSTFGHALTLVQQFVRIAGSDDPGAGAKALDDLLAGRNSEANRAAAGLLDGVTAGMPGEQRDQMASIGRDLAGIARKEARAPLASSPERALQARKDLNAMGLRYYDETQFRDAVKRGDKLAVDLFVAGEGIDPAVVARNLPAAR
jgi:hypothetical protein